MPSTITVVVVVYLTQVEEYGKVIAESPEVGDELFSICLGEVPVAALTFRFVVGSSSEYTWAGDLGSASEVA